MPEPLVEYKSRERPCFRLLEIESREHPYSFRNSCSREHPCRQLGGSDLVSSAPCRTVIYPGPATEWSGPATEWYAQSGDDWLRGAGRAA